MAHFHVELGCDFAQSRYEEVLFDGMWIFFMSFFVGVYHELGKFL